MYGLVKVLKGNNPVRPVVSMIGTPEYQLAKFLDEIIKSCIPQTYMLKSNKQFLDRINNFQFDTNQKLVSFNVSSLFINVSLEETIQLITKRIYDLRHQDVKKQTIPRGIFIKLLRIATQEMFMHKNKLYQQYDVVSMGSPLGPTIANFFLADMENKIPVPQSNADFHPKLYLRYVDDIFCAFNNEASSDKFLDLLNKLHKNIKFTVERGSETLPFLDVEVTMTKSGIETKIYRKQTHTNLLLNFNAICLVNWKSGLVICLLNRAKIMCSTAALFQKEVKELRSMFQENGYPKSYFDKIFKRFLQNKMQKKRRTRTLPKKKLTTLQYHIWKVNLDVS